jgi:hypothetical protein
MPSARARFSRFKFGSVLYDTFASLARYLRDGREADGIAL